MASGKRGIINYYIPQMKIEIDRIPNFPPFKCCLPERVTSYWSQMNSHLNNPAARMRMLGIYLEIVQNRTICFTQFSNDMAFVASGDRTLLELIERYQPVNLNYATQTPTGTFVLLAIWMGLVFWEQNIRDFPIPAIFSYVETKASHLECCHKFVPAVKLIARPVKSVSFIEDDAQSPIASAPDLEKPDDERSADDNDQMQVILEKLQLLSDIATDINDNWHTLPRSIKKPLYERMVAMGLSLGNRGLGKTVCILLAD